MRPKNPLSSITLDGDGHLSIAAVLEVSIATKHWEIISQVSRTILFYQKNAWTISRKTNGLAIC